MRKHGVGMVMLALGVALVIYHPLIIQALCEPGPTADYLEALRAVLLGAGVVMSVVGLLASKMWRSDPRWRRENRDGE